MERELVGVEQQIIAEIEQLRGQFSETQALYREVCVLLFFRHGITPTANKLYQLVRKGSMSAPAEALGKFWSDLREKSRVRIEHPDLPEDLKTAAGDLTAVLWTKAQSLAHESLATLRNEVQATVAEAKASEGTAQVRLESALADLERVSQSLISASEKCQALEVTVAMELAIKSSLHDQLSSAREEIASLHRSNDDARREFSVELDKLRALGQQAEERLRGAEERSLLELDRERQLGRKLQQDLESVRGAANQAADRHRAELKTLQEQIGTLRHQVGVLEGNLQAVMVTKNQLVTEIDGARQNAADANGRASVLRHEADRWREKAEQAEKALAERQSFPKPKTRRKKSGIEPGK